MAVSYSKRPKILAVLHQEGSSAGRVGMKLEEMGYRIEACRPALGDELPETLEEYAGAAIFGGPMSANDPDDFIKREISLPSQRALTVARAGVGNTGPGPGGFSRQPICW